jgi:hypothetical protein
MADFDVNGILLEFIEMIKNNINISNIYIFEYDSLKLIYTNKINSNLHHSNNIIDYILHHIEFILIDSSYNMITYLTKNITLDKSTIELLNNNWNECKIYTNYIGIYCIFLYYNQKKYYITKYRIDNYENSIMTQILPNIFDDIKENESIRLIHKIVVNHRLKHILCYDNELNQKNNISYEPEESQIFYSCYDELDYEHNENIKKMENNKKIFNSGYIIIYKNNKYLLPNTIYEKISKLLPKYSNINKIYIDLYKSDNLNYVINYLSLYPSDIIKRINLSFKTISREYLNIYHMTRKKSHPEIYEKLNEINKKILYDFHTIFITTRQNEYITNTDRNDYYDKKSLSIDTVYKYFKKIDIDILEKIYLDRNELTKTIKEVFNNDVFKIFFEDCINTKTISYLLNKNY